jgi:tripartite-type tricarboxylate transporter receptor subunit TctC
MKDLRAIFAGAALALICGAAQAQAYPSHPIRLVVPYPAGGGTDFFARLAGAKMTEDLGQQILIDNRPGATTIIGAEAVTKSAPDGYTVLLGDTATYAVNPSLYKKLPYDPIKDLDPVTLTVRASLLLVVNNDLPVHSVKELLAYAKSKSGQLNYGSPGAGSPHHLAMEMFKQRTGINATHIPYKGAAPAVQDLIAGQIQLMFIDLGSGGPQIRAGKVRALAIADDKRLASMPDLPTVVEAGYSGFEAYAWQGFTVPTGTPKEIISLLNREYAKVAADPVIQQKLRDVGFEPIPSTPEQLTARIKSEQVKWAKVIKEGNITIE